MIEESREKKRRDRLVLLCLFFGLYFLYLSNVRTVYTGDTVATRFLPFSILLEHHLYVDHWIEPYLFPPGSPKNYFVSRSHGHWMSSYPIITPLVVTPLYIVPSIWMARHSGPIPWETARTIAQGMEKLSAALLAALSACILFLALRKILSLGPSLIIALTYGAASNTWAISSQDLYTHPLGELSFALLLWALLDLPARPRAAFWAGVALALAVADKPPNFVVAFPVMIYFVLRERPRLVAFFAPLCVMGILVLTYNLYYFHNLFGAYSDAFQTMGYSSIGNGFHGSILAGIAGLMVSPSRGLLIYMPWAIFAIWGAVRLWRSRRYPWIRYLMVGLLGLFLVYSKLDLWWGGWTFGPRYLTDLLPFLAFFLTPIWPEIRSRIVLRLAFAVALTIGVWVQVVGAYYFPNGQWNTYPETTEQRPGRLWDWSDTQLIRNWAAGPAPSHIVERWRAIWHRHQTHRQDTQRTD